MALCPGASPSCHDLWSTPARRPSCHRVSAKNTSRGCGHNWACSRRLRTVSRRPAMTAKRSRCCRARPTRFTGPPVPTGSRRRHASPPASRPPLRTGSPAQTIRRWIAARSCIGSWGGSPRCSASPCHARQRPHRLPQPHPARHSPGSARPLVHRGRSLPRRSPPPPPAPAGCRRLGGLRDPVRLRATGRRRSRRLRSPRPDSVRPRRPKSPHPDGLTPPLGPPRPPRLSSRHRSRRRSPSRRRGRPSSRGSSHPNPRRQSRRA